MSQASLFNSIYYSLENTDVAVGINDGDFQNEEEHFEIFGAIEARAPNEIFMSAYYLLKNLDVAEAVSNGFFSNGFEHYQIFGEKESRAPSSDYDGFDPVSYLEINPDVALAVSDEAFTSALDHFITFGRHEDRAGTKITPKILTLTAGRDDFLGSFGADEFIAQTGTLQFDDILNGRGGEDVLSLNLGASLS